MFLKSSSTIASFAGFTAANKKAHDIKILDVSKVSTFTDYFVLCSGNSTTQVKAIADEIEEKMDQKGISINHKEGYKTARWVLLDYGDVIVNIFHHEDREFYSIERLWADVEAISV